VNPVRRGRPGPTPRLTLRELESRDAPFICELLTDPGFLRYIGDRGVRDLDSARRYIEQGPRASYAANGFGLWAVERRDTGAPIGICGLLKRDTLDDVDIGYAMLAAQGGAGFALEAAEATLAWARDALGLRRVVAIVMPDNARSIRLLERLGMRFESHLPPDAAGAALSLYAWSV
jgi:ribosomal-protein-alanine N-acetyltransferase